MKSPLKFLGAAVLALLTVSCFEQESTISVRKDGSGTITQTMLLSAEMVAMAAQGGEDPSAKMADKEKAAEMAAKMGEGVTVEKVEPYEKDGRKGARIVYAFKDINTVKFTLGDSLSSMKDDMGPPGAPGDAPDAVEAAKDDEEPVTFTYKDGVLVVQTPATDKAAEKPADEKKDPAADAMAEQMMAMMAGMMKDMRITLKVEAPGGIAETDASHVDGNTVTLMDMPFGKLVSDPAKMKKLNEMKDASPAEMAAAFKDVEGLKMEPKDKVTLKLK
jgi:hypothetical protein